MAIINKDMLDVNINKMKYYQNEELLNIDSLKKLFNTNNIYTSNNLNQINAYENHILYNLKTINKNNYKSINVLEKTINKYLTIEKNIALKFEELGDKK